MKKLIITPAILLAATLAFTGCIPMSKAASPDKPKPSPSFAEEPAVEEEPEPEVVVDSGVLAFGEAMTWDDNVSLSVSTPAPFTPTEWAAGADQAHHIAFTLVLTNESSEVLEPIVYSRVSSGGAEASQVFDIDNPVGDLTGGPTTAILPGQTVTWVEGYSVADPEVITFQVSPSFEYVDAIFTNIK